MTCSEKELAIELATRFPARDAVIGNFVNQIRPGWKAAGGE